MRRPLPSASRRPEDRPITSFLSRWLGGGSGSGDEGSASDDELYPVGDDVPRNDLFAEPLAVTIATPDPERLDDGWRARFRVEVRDADGQRCPQLAVAAEIAGPERTATGEAHTDMLGRVRFRMAGPAGTYRLRLLHVAGHALEVDRPVGELTATQEVGARGEGP